MEAVECEPHTSDLTLHIQTHNKILNLLLLAIFFSPDKCIYLFFQVHIKLFLNNGFRCFKAPSVLNIQHITESLNVFCSVSLLITISLYCVIQCDLRRPVYFLLCSLLCFFFFFYKLFASVN